MHSAPVHLTVLTELTVLWKTHKEIAIYGCLVASGMFVCASKSIFIKLQVGSTALSMSALKIHI